jgi:hypothetical protein
VRLLAALSLVLLGACPRIDDTLGAECTGDQQCSAGEVCARDNLCWRGADVRFVKATWTVDGMPPSDVSCARHPDLYIQFQGASVIENLGFSPVPCANAQFIVDKLPRDYTRVELGVDRGPWNTTPITPAGVAAIDLRF